MQSIPKPSAVVIDADGTLFHLRESIGTTYSRVARQLEVAVDAGALDSTVKRLWPLFEDEYLNRSEEYRTTPEREERIWREFAKRALVESSADGVTDEVVEAVYRAFAEPSSRVFSEGAIEFIERAVQNGVRVIVATNNDGRTRRILHASDVALRLDAVLSAGELGWKKPSLHFFEEIAFAAELEAGQLLHLGNDPVFDIDPARAAGWQALLYDPSGKYPERANDSVDSFATLARRILPD